MLVPLHYLAQGLFHVETLNFSRLCLQFTSLHRADHNEDGREQYQQTGHQRQDSPLPP
jgi:hypothetical protein